MGFIAWVALIWGIIMIVSSFAVPFMIGRQREPYTPATASVSMFLSIGVGIAVVLLAGSYLGGGAA